MMGAVKNHYWDDLMARTDCEADMEFAAREIEKDETMILPLTDEEIATRRAIQATHDCWEAGEEGAPAPVNEWGAGICKKCGAIEGDLDTYTCDEYARSHMEGRDR